jgi:hypothetical protein
MSDPSTTTLLRDRAPVDLRYADHDVDVVGFVEYLPDTHPQLDFVMRCVPWPRIQPRSLDRLVQTIRAAGVDEDRVTVHLPDDGVYAAATIGV